MYLDMCIYNIIVKCNSFILLYIDLQVENECGEIPTVIVQNKIDLIDQATISK